MCGSVWEMSPFGKQESLPALAPMVQPPTSINTTEGQKQEARKPDVSLLYKKNAAEANRDSTQSTPPEGIKTEDLTLGYKSRLG